MVWATKSKQNPDDGLTICWGEGARGGCALFHMLSCAGTESHNYQMLCQLTHFYFYDGEGGEHRDSALVNLCRSKQWVLIQWEWWRTSTLILGKGKAWCLVANDFLMLNARPLLHAHDVKITQWHQIHTRYCVHYIECMIVRGTHYWDCI